MSHLVTSVDVGTAGASARVSADMVIARTFCMVEDATMENRKIFGLVVDLVKWFNRIPRMLLLAAFLWMGVPIGYLRALEGMLDTLQRFTEIAHQMGGAIPSSCGFPEGCAFSVAAMLMLTIWASSCLKFHHPCVEPNFFAENWAFVCDTGQVLQLEGWSFSHNLFPWKSALARVGFGQAPIAYKGRKSVRSIRIGGLTLQVNHRVTDMGCDVSSGCAKVKVKSNIRAGFEQDQQEKCAQGFQHADDQFFWAGNCCIWICFGESRRR